eukprot:CAMPEP_0174256262 /NCGR_PEP_ID=MMETSP0439-20130205/5512_1 /TAXON_ID=0 /ORGANISM="Stereomyxa ramosa, Strain Chinc5" /LENGTH=335 /DNA_ID=CAMNT_0015338789 /DNA_START=376 /DNA_END=1380 /DNA_ORIENTATION=-
MKGSGTNGGALSFSGLTVKVTLTVVNCSFVNNTASGNGGALDLTGVTQSEFKNCMFTDNTATSGGAVVMKSSVSALNSTFANNSATNYGGAIYITSDESMQIDSSFQDCYIASNEAGNGGGIAVVKGKGLKMSDCTVRLNRAKSQGGGLYITDSKDHLITDSTILMNTAATGGGLYVNAASSGVANLSYSEITTNVATRAGGGIYLNINGSLPTLPVVNAELTNNLALDKESDLECEGNVTVCNKKCGVDHCGKDCYTDVHPGLCVVSGKDADYDYECYSNAFANCSGNGTCTLFKGELGCDCKSGYKEKDLTCVKGGSGDDDWWKKDWHGVVVW